MRPFPKFTYFFCLTEDNLAVTFVNNFIECVFFIGYSKRTHPFFDKQIGSISTNLPIFGTECRRK